MNWTRASIAGFIALALGATITKASAQLPSASTPEEIRTVLTTPPAPIHFSNWQEVATNDQGTEYLENFRSSFFSAEPVNNVVSLRVFIPLETVRAPVVLILHYWGATDLRLERSLAAELNERGIAAAIMTLPYHLSRTPPGSKSGAMAIQPDPIRLEETMIQSVLDARRSLDFLATRPEIRMDKVGISGTSLGAIVTGLVAAIDPRITADAFLLGGVDLAHIIWNSSRVVTQRDTMRRRGMTEEKLRDALAPIEPLDFLRRHHPSSSFVVGGQFDTVVPRQSTEELVDVLQTNNVLWLDTGHYGGIFVQHRLMREVANYFGTEFLGNHFVVPLRIYAPTLRVGFKIDSARGFDLGVGLDLIKFDRKGDFFSTLFITPRGPDLFIGDQIAPGISIGLVGTARTIGTALLWSSVL